MICIIDCQSIVFLPHFSMKEAILRILDPKVVWPLVGKKYARQHIYEIDSWCNYDIWPKYKITKKILALHNYFIYKIKS